MRLVLRPEGEQESVVVTERHAVCLSRVTAHLHGQSLLVDRAGFEPAFAPQNPVHVGARLGGRLKLETSGRQADRKKPPVGP